MMYLAGLASQPRALEAIVAATTFFRIAYLPSCVRKTIGKANTESGPLKSLPTSGTGKIVSRIPALAFFVPQVAYLVSIAASGFSQPRWMLKLALPDPEGGDLLGLSVIEVKTALRVVACAANVVALKAATSTIAVLGSQLGPIGIRERPKVVTAGPYGYVRHPMYTCMLAQSLLCTGMFWSYVPLITTVIMAIAFSMKIPIEEALIEENEKVGPIYKEYKKKVTSKVLPGIW